MQKNSNKGVVLAARPRGEHLDLHAVVEDRKQPRAQKWERLPPSVTTTRKLISAQIGADAARFQTTILCVDSSLCRLELAGFPSADPRELEAMVSASISLFPVLNQPEFVHAWAAVGKEGAGSRVLIVSFRKNELLPLLEKLENWGTGLPLVAPDLWVVWKCLAREHSAELPPDYAWVWVDPARETQLASVKILLVGRGQPLFILQPFVKTGPDDQLAHDIGKALEFAFESCARSRQALAPAAPVYFSSYQMNLSTVLPRIALGGRPLFSMPPSKPPQECAAELWQTERSGFASWLPAFWQEHQRDRARKTARWRLLKIAGAAYLGLVLVLGGFWGWQKGRLSGQERQLSALRGDYEKAVSLKKQASRMRAQAEGSQSALDVLYQATLAMPAELTLTGYQFKFQEGLSLRGFASSNEKVLDFVDALKKQKPFSMVSPNSMRSNPQKNWVEFDIQCKMAAAGPDSAPKMTEVR